jgi:nitroimidazol reductase NimA-like FMN-containing flavoprotein (pyridoxamine 5'-phosphate oxidase superfamily)
MNNMKDLEKEVRSIFRKKNWLVLSTIDDKNIPHSSVVVYQSDGYMIYCMTGKNTLKTRNIRANNKVSITIPFRKNFFHKILPAPPAELHFTAEAEIKPFNDEEARKIFSKYLKYQENIENQEENIWIKITPSSRIITYGVGIPLFKMRNPEKARNFVELKS